MKNDKEVLIFYSDKKGVCTNYNDSLKEYLEPDKNLQRLSLNIPDNAEPRVVRHFTKLSKLNFSLDGGFYPLGSCTMKYNPKVNEDLANLEGFTKLHPYQSEYEVQGAMELMFNLGEALKEIAGLDGVSLIPAAGAHGENAGIRVIDAYHKNHGGFRKKIIVPDTAHGTNPASCSLAGHEVITVKSVGGVLSAKDIENIIDEDTACLMLTNPNTLGFFESDLESIAKLLHSKGAFLYCDGANTNAWMGKVKLGAMGVDVIQYNLHKTFSTPHGGGGPGSGPIVVSKKLCSYLPNPQIVKDASTYTYKYLEKSIGSIKNYYGNFLVLVKAYSYILSLGPEGIKKVAEIAVLNANYIKARLKPYYDIPFSGANMHEVVLSDKFQNEYGVKTMDIAKRLLDYGVHPPTVYFPLVVNGAIMIEPTETESIEDLDYFCDVMISIAQEAKTNPELLLNAPTCAPVRRCNEVKAVKDKILCC